MNTINGMTNSRPKLVGILNNSILGNSTPTSGNSILIEDKLLKSKWIEVTGEGKFIYQYSNEKLNDNYFIQMTPDVSDTERLEISKAGISQNIYMDSEVSKTIYNIYSKNRPTIDIKISILATNIKE